MSPKRSARRRLISFTSALLAYALVIASLCGPFAATSGRSSAATRKPSKTAIQTTPQAAHRTNGTMPISDGSTGRMVYRFYLTKP